MGLETKDLREKEQQISWKKPGTWCSKDEGLIPARDPKQCGGSRRIKHYNVDDDDDDDDDVDDDDDDDDEDDDEDDDDYYYYYYYFYYHDTAQIGPRNADIHFVRAWAIEMHVHMSQESSEEPLYTDIYQKNATAQNADTHFVRACAVEMHVKISQEPLYTEIYR